MGNVVELGLLKMDFLGLRNLDVIDKAVELVGGIDIEQLPLDDREDVQDARPRRGDRRLPVRVVGHARGAAAGEADGVRGPDRARRPLPAGADGATSRSTRAASTARSPSPISTSGSSRSQETHTGSASRGTPWSLMQPPGGAFASTSYASTQTSLVQGVDEDSLRTEHARITHWVDNGRRPVYRLRLRNGATITATARSSLPHRSGLAGASRAKGRRLSRVRRESSADCQRRTHVSMSPSLGRSFESSRISSQTARSRVRHSLRSTHQMPCS